jgi:predicted XRE-type DNA-binding protein
MGTAIATELEQRDDIVQHIDEWLEQTGSDQRCSGVVYVKRSDGTGYFKAALSPVSHRESHNGNRVGI